MPRGMDMGTRQSKLSAVASRAFVEETGMMSVTWRMHERRARWAMALVASGVVADSKSHAVVVSHTHN